MKNWLNKKEAENWKILFFLIIYSLGSLFLGYKIGLWVDDNEMKDWPKNFDVQCQKKGFNFGIDTNTDWYVCFEIMNESRLPLPQWSRIQYFEYGD